MSKFIIKVSFKRQRLRAPPKARPPAVTERPLGRCLVQELAWRADVHLDYYN